MKTENLKIPSVILITPDIFEDERGFFVESYQKERFAIAGISYEFVQDNHSKSMQGVLRGLHYQIKKPQGKLIRVVAGEIFDVAVDLRKASATFGQWVGAFLSAENKKQLWIPPGFAHGFYVVSRSSEVLYKATDYYAPEWERNILWNDPRIGIQWPLINGEQPNLSIKDANAIYLDKAEVYE